jgi:glucokinase
VIDEAGEIVSRRTIPTEGHEGHDAVLGRMVQGAAALRNEVGSTSAVEAVGVGVPGMLDMRSGTTLDLPNLPGKWPNVAVKEIMEAALHVPVHLINDVKAFTIAELELGAAKGATNVVCYAVGTGIGGGVVFDGKVHFGIGGAAGELGHIIVNPSGVRCSCGNRGCVEALASGPAIIGEANRRVVQGFTTRLTALVHEDLNRMSPAIVEQAAEEGDEIAREVLERAGYYLGLSMAGIIAALAPDVVVVGGGVVKPHGVYWKSFEATARANNTVTEMSRVSFVPAMLGYQAGVIGAALWGRMVERGEAVPAS